MKGVIVHCLQKLVVEKFGQEKWENSLRDAGVNQTAIFLPTSQVEDATVMEVVGAVCKNLGITLNQAADAFGEYWVNTYSQTMYSNYYKSCNSAKEFLLQMDNVHLAMTRSMKDARPPRFSYEWKDENTLVMTYKSHRGLIDFAVGLIKGVGIYYKENLKVSKHGSDKLQIVFQPVASTVSV